MIEENFNTYNSIPGANSPGMLTFGEYLDKKDELSEFFSSDKFSEMPTFLEYLESKNVKIEIVENEKIEDKIKDIMESEALSSNILNNLDLLVNKNLDFKSNLIKRLDESKSSKDMLWESYVDHINKRVSRYVVARDIQDPKYLYASKFEMSKLLIIEQRKIHDRIYFFTPGGGSTTEDISESIIGTAIIGKSKIM
jgi:hypothetical protein